MSHPRRQLLPRFCLALVIAGALALPAAAAPSTAPGPAAAIAALSAAPSSAPAAGRGAVEQALQAVAQASAEARRSAAAASAAAGRMAALERAVEQLRQEAQTSRVEADALRDQLGRTETPRWAWLLGGLAAVLAVLAGWLGWRLSVAHQAARAVAAAPAPPAEPDLATALDATDRLPRSAPPAPQPVAARAPEASLEESPQPAGREPDVAVHDVSIDELLDLEQQADFFVVLGQDEAAIELLVEHLRHTGGGGPLPYLKLLEIHRRRGDRGDYERTRARFNRRFNAYAPEWEVDLQTGRNLSDYAGAIPRLQQVWSRPLDSMAELEAMIFRKSQGELFDLPAYREILFLYALARDLLDRESADTGKVDLLLPLSDRGEFSSTLPMPFLDIGRDAKGATADFEDRPTSPVDLDISFDGERAPSIFDPRLDLPGRARLF